MGRLLTLLGDAAPAFTPAALPDLALWLDPAYGVYTDGAANFDGNNANYLSVPSNNGLQTGDVDFYVCGWVRATDLSVYRALAVKGTAGSYNSNEFLLWYNQIASRFEFSVSSGASNAQVRANTFGAPSTNTYYFVFAYHDAAADTINISVNGGAFDSQAFTRGGGVNAAALALGTAVGSDTLAGSLDSVAFGKPTDIGAVAATLAQSLYNGGAGKGYADLTAADKSGLVSWYNLDETTGTRFDSHGSNNLAMNGTVGWNAGVAAGQAGDNDPVSKWVARTGQVFTAPSVAARPTYKTNAGKPYLLFDGVDDQLGLVSFTATRPWSFGIALSNWNGSGRAIGSAALNLLAGAYGFGGLGGLYLGAFVVQGSLKDTNPHAVVATSSLTESRSYLDGADITVDPSPTADFPQLLLGTGTGEFFGGRIAGFVATADTLSATSRTLLTTYLTGRV